ncbi:MAG: diaminopimelate epimerase [Chitinophagaceae bacterium]|jgi:diaminopimelate epimerase|nr:diaminopimelate epimerase [Chitinophagaceae bacterium]
MKVHFYKYQGTGNDFILVDNREGRLQLTTQQIAAMCQRRFGIGADGLMELRTAPGYDFRMVYYNADGREGSMCGNGGRCLVKFAHYVGIHKSEFRFLAIDGEHLASIETNGWVRLKMQDVQKVDHFGSYELLNTGSPHFVKTVQDLNVYPVVKEGSAIRNSDKFKADGVNVNFVQPIGETYLFVRTYERGVEDETLSCGTGVTASALVNAHNDRGFNHVDIKTLGGKLYVEFDRTDDDSFENIWLAGPADKVFDGFIDIV